MDVTADPCAQLEQSIRERTARVAILGLGYVGLPLARAFFDAGFPVLGHDLDPERLARLASGEGYLRHLGKDIARPFAGSSRFEASRDPARLGSADALFICVPTPLGRHREPDLSHVLAATEAVAAALRPGQLVVLTSTTYPRTTRDEVLPILERRGLRCGTDFFLAFSPEREDPGRPGITTATTPRVVGGIDEVSGRLAARLLGEIVRDVHLVASTEIAESAKLLENIYRAVNIALVNELKVLLNEMEIDVWEVIAAASTKPFGFQPFYPGPGLGGHCIPIDPFYLTWKAKEYGLHTRFIELAGEINTYMPHYVVYRATRALNDVGKPPRGSRVLILGVAYKPDVDDVRESPSFEVLRSFEKAGCLLTYHDPHVDELAWNGSVLHSQPLSEELLATQDCVVVLTAHRAIDWELVARHAPLVVDTRNVVTARPGGAVVVKS